MVRPESSTHVSLTVVLTDLPMLARYCIDQQRQGSQMPASPPPPPPPPLPPPPPYAPGTVKSKAAPQSQPLVTVQQPTAQHISGTVMNQNSIFYTLGHGYLHSVGGNYPVMAAMQPFAMMPTPPSQAQVPYPFYCRAPPLHQQTNAIDAYCRQVWALQLGRN